MTQRLGGENRNVQAATRQALPVKDRRQARGRKKNIDSAGRGELSLVQTDEGSSRGWSWTEREEGRPISAAIQVWVETRFSIACVSLVFHCISDYVQVFALYCILYYIYSLRQQAHGDASWSSKDTEVAGWKGFYFLSLNVKIQSKSMEEKKNTLPLKFSIYPSRLSLAPVLC